jgi:hypothetical protein
MLEELFLEHPRSVGETYGEHQRRAFWFAGVLIRAGLACALHGLIPSLCKTTGSDTVKRLYGEMTGRSHLAVENSLPAEALAGANI